MTSQRLRFKLYLQRGLPCVCARSARKGSDGHRFCWVWGIPCKPRWAIMAYLGDRVRHNSPHVRCKKNIFFFKRLICLKNRCNKQVFKWVLICIHYTPAKSTTKPQNWFCHLRDRTSTDRGHRKWWGLRRREKTNKHNFTRAMCCYTVQFPFILGLYYISFPPC